MSNIGSSAMQTAKAKGQSTPHVPAASAKQQKFQQGTMGMLDEARSVIENAVGQGSELNPMIYQMLGLSPQYEDHSGDLQSAQSAMDAAQKQYDEAQKTVDTIRGIPKGKRTPEQRKQFNQLKKQIPSLQKALGSANDALGKIQTMPKTITGLSRLDPSQIPENSPFSSLNPLNQAQAAEAGRLNDYLKGGEVDPTLKHQYDQAESALRTKLAQRFGPDYEASSVGQMALQNFMQTKNNAFATWNEQQVQKYNDLAFQGQANLQSLLGGQIGLMREPSTTQIGMGNALANDAQQRLQQEQIVNQMRLGRAGVSTSTSNFSPAGAVGSGLQGLGQLLTTPYNQQGSTLAGKLTGTNPAVPESVTVPSYGGGSALNSWMGGGGAAEAAAAEGAGASLAGDYGASSAAAALL
jgi:prefoldin subunit 5